MKIVNKLIQTKDSKPKAFLLPDPSGEEQEITIKRKGKAYVLIMSPDGIDLEFTYTLQISMQSVTVFNKKGQWWIK